MEVILKTTDITQVSFVKMLLSCEGIKVHVLDQHMSLLEGSINILPIKSSPCSVFLQGFYSMIYSNVIG